MYIWKTFSRIFDCNWRWNCVNLTDDSSDLEVKLFQVFMWQQLQLSHDDYDNTLNVHVIQAVNLRPRDINGLSDPFVKVYLLPGRG